MTLVAALLLAVAAPIAAPQDAPSPTMATASATASVMIVRAERVNETDPARASHRSVRREAGGLIVEFN